MSLKPNLIRKAKLAANDVKYEREVKAAVAALKRQDPEVLKQAREIEVNAMIARCCYEVICNR